MFNFPSDEEVWNHVPSEEAVKFSKEWEKGMEFSQSGKDEAFEKGMIV
jgi:hypothetical protein